MNRRLLLPALLIALLVPAATAYAISLPKPSNSSIVVPTELGGIKIGMPEAKAKKAWGGAGRGQCESTPDYGRCSYGDSNATSGYATVDFRKGKVTSVAIYAGRTPESSEQLTTAAAVLEGIQTKEGIGLGAKVSKLKSAYPKGESEGSAKEGFLSFVVKGKGKHAMIFNVGETKKVYAIFLTDGIGG